MTTLGLIDPELYAATRAAIDEARERVDALQAAGRTVPKNHKVGEVSTFECGLPNISTPLFPNVEDYAHVFGLARGDYFAISYDELPELQTLIALARSR